MDWAMAGVLSAVIIACAGGVGGWIKFLLDRMMTANDAKHAEHVKRADDIERQSDLRYAEHQTRDQQLSDDLHTLALKLGTDYLTRHEFREVTADQTRLIEGGFARVHQRLDDLRGSK